MSKELVSGLLLFACLAAAAVVQVSGATEENMVGFVVSGILGFVTAKKVN